MGSIGLSWKVASLVHGGDVRDSDVEDAPARVLLAFDGDHSTLSQAPADSLVINPRSDRVRKIVAEAWYGEIRLHPGSAASAVR